jgi:cell division protein FtsI (penicillin-binding protein 3)
VTPRGDDTPRRGQEPRRGSSSEEPEEQQPGRGRGTRSSRGTGSGGIGAARAYTPRGRTVRETDQRTRSPRAARDNDPFRPALQVLDGGRPARKRRDEDVAPQRKPARAAAAASSEDDFDFDEPAPERGRGARVRSRGEPARATAGAGRTTAGTGRARRTADPRREPGKRTATRTVKKPAPIAPEPPRLANATKRLRLGTVLALTLFAAVGVRLVVLQVSDSPAQAQSMLEQRQKRITEVEIPAARGSILDREGKVLAQSVEARFVYADPTMVTDPQAAARQLSPLLGVSVSALADLMTQKKRPGGGPSRFEYLARGVDVSVADQIKKMQIPGIGTRRDERRDVPGADLAANLIGFTGDGHAGLEGLEARYDEILRGVNGEKVYEVGNADGKVDLGKEIPGGYHRETPASPGSSLQLTIDSDLQYQVQGYLQKYMDEKNANSAAAVVMDAKTGEVLAQASYPTYNASKPFDSKPTEREDVATSVVADPGSTHKAFTIGAAMQEGLITKDSTVTVGPARIIGGKPFQDHHVFAAGTKITIPQVLAYSSNIGTIAVGDRLGKEKLYEYQQKFGLGRPTKEGMPGEAPGQLLEPADWSGSAAGSVPIGLSVSATLVQMVGGYGAIANDGVYIQPHLVKSTISGRDGKVTSAAQPETHRVLDASVAADLRTMMEAVVYAKDGTGSGAKVAGFRVSGKTGTGRMIVDGKYTTYASSFIGMAPAENPRFVVGVFADVPNGGGGDVAAPAFSKMMSSALLHYAVPPSSTPAPKFVWKD